MRSFRVDQFEFDDPGSEECVEIDVSRQSAFPTPDIRSFVGATVGVQAAAALVEPQPFHRVEGRGQVADYIRRFAGIEVPLHADWPTYTLEAVTWDAVHLVIGAPGLFVRYQWSTTA